MSQLITNRKATFNYEILEKIEAGLVLKGFEVKSLRNGKGSLDGSYITLNTNGANLIGATISPYQANNMPKDYDQKSPRKILLSKKDLRRLSDKLNTKGLSLIPLSIYPKGRNLKIEIALAKGKKKTDKRQSIKEREDNREIERVMKERR